MEQEDKGQVGIWTEPQEQYYSHSEKLASNLEKLFDENKGVIDFGCGDGFYLNKLAESGKRWIIGYDGYRPYNAFIPVTIAGLTKPLESGLTGNVLCLEVGEHIPEEFEHVILDTVTQSCSGTLVLSWAVPGQPGIGHINCKSNEYIIQEVESRGLKFNRAISDILRNNIEDEYWWFRNTLMVFER